MKSYSKTSNGESVAIQIPEVPARRWDLKCSIYIDSGPAFIRFGKADDLATADYSSNGSLPEGIEYYPEAAFLENISISGDVTHIHFCAENNQSPAKIRINFYMGDENEA